MTKAKKDHKTTTTGRGSNFTTTHQKLAAMAPRGTRRPDPRTASEELRAAAAALPLSDETMDEASLRLQRARANCEELDQAKRQIELDKSRGELVTKAESIDLAQAAVLKVCQILDLLPERLRDRVPTVSAEVVAALESEIYEARAKVASGI